MGGFAKRFLEAFKESGLTGAQLADLAGCSNARITRAKNDEQVGGIELAVAIRMAKALGVRVAWLAIGEEPKRPAHGMLVVLQGDALHQIAAEVRQQIGREQEPKRGRSRGKSPISDNDRD